MAAVQLINLIIKNAHHHCLDGFPVELTFDAQVQLQHDLIWKFIFFGSPCDQQYDQVLDEFCITACQPGIHRFQVNLDAPNLKQIPPNDILGCTALVLVGQYAGRQFVRCGYYVSTNYNDEQLLQNPPEQIDINRVFRTIIVDKPRLFNIPIKWGIEGYGIPYPTEEEEQKLEQDYTDIIRNQMMGQLEKQMNMKNQGLNQNNENAGLMTSFTTPEKF